MNLKQVDKKLANKHTIARHDAVNERTKPSFATDQIPEARLGAEPYGLSTMEIKTFSGVASTFCRRAFVGLLEAELIQGNI